MILFEPSKYMKKDFLTIDELKTLPSLKKKVDAVFSNIESEKTEFENLYPSDFKQKFFFYYRSFGKTNSQLRLRFYRTRLRKALELSQGKRVLIIGSGLGTEAFLFRACGASSVVGIDIDPIFIPFSNQRAKTWEARNVIFKEECVFTYNTDERFDLVFIMETFHHIVPKEKFFPVVSNFLKPDGLVVVSEPNGGNPLITWNLQRKGWMTGVIKTLGRYQMTDEMVAPMSTVRKLMKKADFKIVKKQRYRIFPGLPLKRLDALLALIEPIVEKMLPLSIIGIGYTIIGKKK